MLALVATPAAGGGDFTRHADFVYVDANEGNASGGHVALGLGDRTYHFGYQEPGFLRLDRDDTRRFRHVYGALENRNLQLLRVAVSDDTFDRLRASFNERYLREAAEFATLTELERDRMLFEAWSKGPPRVQVRGAGYLVPTHRDPAEPSDALARLRARVAARHGADFVARRRHDARRDLAALVDSARQPVATLAPTGRHPVRGYGLSRRAEDALAQIEALDILERGGDLRSEATVGLAPEAFPLDASTRRTIERLRRSLEGDLVDLAASRRPDVGFVFLVGMARLVAIERTLEQERLVVLDVLPADSARLSVEEIVSRGGRLATLSAELRAELDRTRAALNEKSALREADWTAVETVATRLHEVEHAGVTGRDLRVAPGPLLPQRAADRALAGPSPEADTISQRIEEIRARESELRDRLDAEHHYGLVTHNCVSELFAQIEAAVGEDAAIERLGGPVPGGRGLDVIPFVAADAVGRTWRVDEVTDLSAYRRRRVNEMVETDGVWVEVRESNVLTSTLYESNSLDSAFLFFTDDTPLARPLLGAANLVYGLGATVVGIGFVPADGGRRLGAGLRGTLWSLPELAFVNVRKGSFFHVPSGR